MPECRAHGSVPPFRARQDFLLLSEVLVHHGREDEVKSITASRKQRGTLWPLEPISSNLLPPGSKFLPYGSQNSTTSWKPKHPVYKSMRHILSSPHGTAPVLSQTLNTAALG